MVVEAAEQGKRAARSIHEYLTQCHAERVEARPSAVEG
jgi:hypothetical protein